LKIAFFSHRFYPFSKVGGLQLRAYELARYLVQRGHDVTVYTSGDMASSRIAKTDGVNVIIYPRLNPTLQNLIGFPWYMAPAMLTTLLKRQLFGIDVIQAFGSWQFFCTLVAVLAKTSSQIPLAVSIPGLGPSSMSTRQSEKDLQSLWRAVYKHSIGIPVLKHADVVLVQTRIGKNVIENMGIASSKIKVIPGGIDANLFNTLPSPAIFRSSLGLSEDDRLILSVGSTGIYKGSHTLISALGRIVAGGKNVKLIFVGPDVKTTRSLVDSLLPFKIREKVIILGPLVGKALVSAYSACDVFVLASAGEGFGRVYLEAAASGLPIIATNTGVAPDLVTDGENGVFVQYGELTQLVAAINRILACNDFRRNAESLRKSFVQNYDLNKIILAYLKVYQDMISSKTS
jgi:glycosyltransferase involved in cell wall biosynthesis